VKKLKNIFTIKLITSLLFAFFTNVGAMEPKVVRLKKVRPQTRKSQILKQRKLEAQRQEALERVQVQEALVLSKLDAGENSYYGKGVPKDYKQALNHFADIVEISKTQFVDKPVLLSVYRFLGLIYLFGDDKVKKDREKAFKIFNDIAISCEAKIYNILAYIEANYCLGLMSYYEKKYGQALKYFNIVPDIPDIKKLYPFAFLDIKRFLGIMCFCGYGVEQNVLKSQLCFFDVILTLNAEKINSEAFRASQNYLKIMYFCGSDGTDELVTFHYKNIVNAIDTQKINTIDWINSHYFFALSYWSGSNNISQNTVKALIHFFAILAARDAEKLAPEIFLAVHNFLGRAYFYGYGVKQNDKKAKIIFKKIINMPNSLGINLVAWLDAKEHLYFLGQDYVDAFDLLIENSL
jgi:TPR repeat protein